MRVWYGLFVEAGDGCCMVLFWYGVYEEEKMR